MAGRRRRERKGRTRRRIKRKEEETDVYRSTILDCRLLQEWKGFCVLRHQPGLKGVGWGGGGGEGGVGVGVKGGGRAEGAWRGLDSRQYMRRVAQAGLE